MNDNNECCPHCEEKFKPSDRVVARCNETGEVFDRCVLCGEHFKGHDDLVAIRFQHNEVGNETPVHLICAFRGQLPEAVEE